MRPRGGDGERAGIIDPHPAMFEAKFGGQFLVQARGLLMAHQPAQQMIEVQVFGLPQRRHPGEIGGQPILHGGGQRGAGEVRVGVVHPTHHRDAGAEIFRRLGPVQLLQPGGERLRQSRLDFLGVRRRRAVAQHQIAQPHPLAYRDIIAHRVEPGLARGLAAGAQEVRQIIGIQRRAEADFRALAVQRRHRQQPVAGQRVGGREIAGATA